jgi:hypothetical protein
MANNRRRTRKKRTKQKSTYCVFVARHPTMSADILILADQYLFCTCIWVDEIPPVIVKVIIYKKIVLSYATVLGDIEQRASARINIYSGISMMMMMMMIQPR